MRRIIIICFCAQFCSLWSLRALADQAVLVENVNGYTLNADGDLVRFSSLLVEAGKVSALDPKSLPDSNLVRIDGKQRTMLPGLIDAHGHLMGLGKNLLQVDVRESASARDAARMVADYVFANSQQQWVTGRGWNQELWPDKAFPNASQLDEAEPSRPVWLRRVDGHAGWANTRALKIAGITKDTPDPQGGQILRDSDGNPTGVLIDNAMELVEQHLPTTTTEQYAAQLEAAGQHLLSVGITAMHDAGVERSLYDFYLAMAAEKKLPIRIYAMISATDPDLDKMLNLGRIRSLDDFINIRSVKAYGDGALGSRGAALLEPYSDAPEQHGLMLTQPDQFGPLFNHIIGSGFQLNFHAIGDKANHLALDQFAQTFAKLGGQALRNRIEHAQVITPDDLERFAELKILPSMQPTHATSDKNMAEARLGKARMKGAYAWQTLHQSGIAIPLGSDFPVELANPFYGLHAAVTRQDRNNQPVKGWYPEEALTLEQAFRGFTLDAAYAAHSEDTLGSLMPGKWADFILLDQDIFAIEAQDIWKTRVLQTWVAGQQVYSAQP
ncbi:amidohydrolase [Alteromonas aestuariivivens]|uniref:Amidohydrolase n=1 Tax=Alteromonas aestuariivivens TaxID=1938339 RepID=A0A3D8M321_9ALTE|nr:amidohydrolase [Alteromonas aestuariivivens]RDV24041.1 amidohydrolase [Alteromonas aestuariivivens]